jgi:hypothetical protein
MRPVRKAKEAFYLTHFFSQGAIGEEELLSFILTLDSNERANWCRVAPMLFIGTKREQIQRVSELACLVN